METRPPTTARILIAVGFAISCFGLALFLWLAFGGPIPLKAEGYRFSVPFTEATQLAAESDVRISGVSVGKVKSIELSDDGYADSVIELEARYAPIPSDTQAVLRQKTLLGETYVELTPGSSESEPLPEGDSLPPAQVSDAVQLDEIFRTFDPRTRAAFQDWMQGAAAAFRGRGEDFSITLASLPGFADQADRLLRLLDSQDVALKSFVREGGAAFGALSERSGQLRGTIENSAEVFATTADRNQDLIEIFRIFPTFLRESRETLTRLEQFAVDTDPVAVGLQPAARELEPTLLETQRLATTLDSFFPALLKATDVGPRGLKATRSLLDKDLPPLLEGFNPWLADFNAVLKVFEMYKLEVTSLVANVAAASNGVFFNLDTGESVNYLRTEAPLMPEAISTYPNRLQMTRTNPYFKPGGFNELANTLRSFETRQCASGLQAFLDATAPSNPAFNSHVGGDVAEAQAFFDRLQLYAFNDQLATSAIPQVPCHQQQPYSSIGAPSEQSQYLHVRELP
jgi:virulence factor Mce-like protein